MSKQVLVVVIDALTSRTLKPAIQMGRLPALSGLAAAGAVTYDCTSIFPSITPAATASIVTGAYPAEHGIAGASWYDPGDETIAYYGDDVWTIVKEGMGKYFEDFLVRLNHQWLKAPTLFQLVEREGLAAACINYLIYRGNHRHKVHVPLVLGIWPGIPFSAEISGPSTLCLGDFVAESPDGVELSAPGGILHRFGMEDESTAEFLLQLARHRALPDLTVAYFADHDYRAHEVGPEAAIACVEDVDRHLGALIDTWGGIEPFLQQFCVLITGDHSQGDILADAEDASIALDSTLAEWDIAAPADGWTESSDQIMICPNMRAAEIYLREPSARLLDRIAARLLEDGRIDQVLWRADHVDESGRGYHVRTADRGSLWFARDDGASGRDARGNRWTWRGDLRTVDASTGDSNALDFGDYPNAFERLAGGLDHRNSGHIWVTARPGHEFLVAGGSVHVGGGSHGSLHAVDSLVPLIASGLPSGMHLPEPCRTLDVTPLALSALGLDGRTSLHRS